MQAYLATLVASLLWLAVIVRIQNVRGGYSDRALFAVLVSLACAATLDIPQIRAAIANAFPESANVPTLMKFMLVVAATAAARETVRGLATSVPDARRGLRVRLSVAAVAEALLVALYVAAPVHERYAHNFIKEYSNEPLAGALAAVYFAFIMWTALGIYKLQRWYAEHLPSSELRTGIRIVGLGSLACFIYFLQQSWYVLARELHLGPPFVTPWDDLIALALFAPAALLLIGGVIWPASPHRPLVRTVRAAVALWRLRPLWAELRREMPDLGFRAFPVGLSWRPRDLESSLYDVVIEIRDVLLVLGRRVPVTAAALAPSRPAVNRDAVAYHLALMSPATTSRRGASPWRPEATPAQPDMDGETGLLVDLAACWRDARAEAARLMAAGAVSEEYGSMHK